MTPLLIPLGVVGSSKLPLSPYWIAIYGSETNVSNPYGYEAPQGMSVDQSGNSYIAGFGYPDYGSSSDPVGLLAKQNPMGELLLQKSFGIASATECHLFGVDADSSENIYIHGRAGGRVGTSSTFWNYYFVAKLNQQSNSISWQKQIGDGTAAGSYSGFHHNNNDIDQSGNFYTSVFKKEGAVSEYYITKFSSAGSASWVKKLASTEYGFFDKLKVDNSGNVFTGYDVALSGSFSEARAMITKLDSSGTLQWAKKLNMTSTSQYSSLLGMSPDNSGGVSIAGYGYDNSNSEIYGFVTRFSSSGTTVWSRKILNALARDVSVGSDGSVYVYGDDRSPGSSKMLLMKFSSLGTLIWQRDISGLGAGQVSSIEVDSNNDIFISFAYFNSDSGSKTGMVTLKLPSDGSLTGTHGGILTYSPSALSDSAMSIGFVDVSVSSTSVSLPYSNSSLLLSDESIEFKRINVR
jgi:hypothetical protein